MAVADAEVLGPVGDGAVPEAFDEEDPDVHEIDNAAMTARRSPTAVHRAGRRHPLRMSTSAAPHRSDVG